jgi:Na+-translocating ferredoxin:NAD+ oxidoreductase subunit B
MAYDKQKYDHAKAPERSDKPKKARKARPKAVVFCNGGCTEVGICKTGCVGCGTCATVCRKGAIVVSPAGFARVNQDLCIGCGLCARECPQQVIKLIEPRFNITARCSNESPGVAVRQICATGCISCGQCEKACPAGAIRVTNNHPEINYDLCIACGMCAVKCPRGVIRDAFGIVAEK